MAKAKEAFIQCKCKNGGKSLKVIANIYSALIVY